MSASTSAPASAEPVAAPANDPARRRRGTMAVVVGAVVVALAALVVVATRGPAHPPTLNERVSAVPIQTAKWDPLDGRRQVTQQIRCSRAQLQGIVPSGKHEHRG